MSDKKRFFEWSEIQGALTVVEDAVAAGDTDCIDKLAVIAAKATTINPRFMLRLQKELHKV